jgi:hypothetical protein
MNENELENELLANGLRLASEDEAGWTYTYVDEDGNRRSLWVTEL